MRKVAALAAAIASLSAPGLIGNAVAAIPQSEILMHEDRRDAAPLLRALDEPADPPTAARIAVALGRIGDRLAVEPLGSLLHHSSPEVRAAAAFALGEVEDSAACPHLAARLAPDAEPAPAVRAFAVEALGKIGCRTAEATAIAALEDPSDDVRGEAALACWRLQLAGSVPRLAAIARVSSGDLRWRAVYSLARMLGAPTSGRTPSAGAVAMSDTSMLAIRGVLTQAAGDADPRIRIACARGLGVFGDPDCDRAIGQMLRDPDWRVRVEAARAWSAAPGPDRPADPLAELLDDPNPNARIAAVEALARYPASAAALDALVRMRSAPHPRLRETAGLSLAALLAGRKEGAAPDSIVALDARLRELAREAASDSIWRIRASAAEILTAGQLADSSILARLLEDDPRVAKAAVEPFLRLRAGSGPAASSFARIAPDLDRLLSEQDSVIRSIALEAAGSILGDSIPPEILPAWVARLRDAWEAAANDSEADVPLTIAALLERCGEDPAARDLAAAVAERRPAATDRGLDDYEEILQWASSPRGVEIATTGGIVKIALFSREAPIACWNFARLAGRGFFDGGAWHRIVPDFVVQDGCPRGDGFGGPGYTIRCEINAHRYETGSVGMALSGKDTGGSQFFITHSPQPHLDGRYTVFGRIVSGQEIVDRLIQGDPIGTIRVIEP